MTLQWNGTKVLAEIHRASAEGLLRAAQRFATEHKLRVSVSSPHHSAKRTRDTKAGAKGSSYQVYTAPSRPGEYPRLRTGAGRGALRYEPTTADGIVQAGLRVRIGFLENEPHLLYLELASEKAKRRKGLLDTLKDLHAELAQLATGKGP